MKYKTLLSLFLVSCLVSCAIAPEPIKQGYKIALPYPTMSYKVANTSYNEEQIALEVFADTKAHWRPMENDVVYGDKGHFATPSESVEHYFAGDCKSFSIFVRSELAKRGVDSRLVIVTSFGNDRHMITVTKKGYVLDTKLPSVASLSHLDYKILSMTGFNGDDHWYASK